MMVHSVGNSYIESEAKFGSGTYLRDVQRDFENLVKMVKGQGKGDPQLIMVVMPDEGGNEAYRRIKVRVFR